MNKEEINKRIKEKYKNNKYNIIKLSHLFNKNKKIILKLKYNKIKTDKEYCLNIGKIFETFYDSLKESFHKELQIKLIYSFYDIHEYFQASFDCEDYVIKVFNKIVNTYLYPTIFSCDDEVFGFAKNIVEYYLLDKNW